MGKYISSLPGIFKIITAVFGIIICILAIVSWPRDDIILTDTNLWKYYIFLAFSANALACTVATLAFLAFRHKASGMILKLDGGLSIIVGIILLVTAALLLQEIVSQYNDISDVCELISDEFGIEAKSQNGSGIFGLLKTRSYEDDQEAAEKCEETYHGSTDREHLIKACRCFGRYLIKFGTNVAAGVMAILNFLAFAAVAGLSLRG